MGAIMVLDPKGIQGMYVIELPARSWSSVDWVSLKSYVGMLTKVGDRAIQFVFRGWCFEESPDGIFLSGGGRWYAHDGWISYCVQVL